ncbi:MAG: hypothetical protein ACRC92_02335 [Peptostreptococcaceae bacterium]
MTIKDYFNKNINFTKVNPSVEKYIRSFITINSDVYLSDGFSKKLIFGEQRKRDMLRIYGFDVASYNNFAPTNPTLSTGFATVNDSLNLLLLTSNMKVKSRMFLEFLAIKIYTSKYARSFPYGVKEPEMLATISGLSNRYLVKKHKTMQATVSALVDTYCRRYAKELDRLSDEDYLELVNGISTRVGIMIRNVAREYYANTDKQYSQKDNTDEENFIMTTNESLKIEGAMNSVINYNTTRGVDLSVLKSVNGMKYKSYYETLFREEHNAVNGITREILNGTIKAKKCNTVSDVRANIVTYSVKNKSGAHYKEIDKLIDKHSIPDKIKFRETFIKYMSVKIYKELL